MKKALLIAYHFPPVSVSSGLQRTLSMTRYLPDFDWQPVVLSAHPRAYRSTSEGQLDDIPEGTVVKRAFALDTRKHLSIGGRYLRFMALPDQWVSWCMGGVFSGLRLVSKYRPSVIWTTYPIATAHLIGLVLQRFTGLPWVADFRDSMTEADYPVEPSKRKIYRWIEKQTVNACSKAIFTTPGTLEMYRQRYPAIPDERWELIPNGYDEGIFLDVEENLKKEASEPTAGPKILLHSGLIYPSERDPRSFFEAISNLKKAKTIDSGRLRVRLRATGHDSLFCQMLEEYDIADIVELAPSISYREALSEIMKVDGLIILQASNCNHQVPAKVYEYLRAQRPVVGLTDKTGDTAGVMMNAGLGDIAPLDDSKAIAATLSSFLQKLEQGVAPVASQEAVLRSSRRYGAEKLAKIFRQVTGAS